jgi:hypothetical protein
MNSNIQKEIRFPKILKETSSKFEVWVSYWTQKEPEAKSFIALP